jgi:hypothetical protein
MSLLSSHLQVHDGLLVALAELLAVAERDLTVKEIRRYLQPPRLGDRTPDVVDLTVEAAQWLGLAHQHGDRLTASPELGAVAGSQIELRLAGLIRHSLLAARRNPSASGAAAESQGRDLARALAWFLAQDAWDPPPDFERVEGSAESRQARQLPGGPQFVNKTKWPFLCRWAIFLGLGVPDPIDPRRVVPDPTVAVRDELQAADRDTCSARELVEFLATRCPVLDGGDIRVTVTELVVPSELRWEHDDAVISPSLSMAILRLEHERILIRERRADTPVTERRSLTVPEGMSTMDYIRLRVRPPDD